jgi:hypothetical protein
MLTIALANIRLRLLMNENSVTKLNTGCKIFNQNASRIADLL